LEIEMFSSEEGRV